jgi:hypothetical protein
VYDIGKCEAGRFIVMEPVAGHPVRISGYEVWRMGADGLIANSQGRFDAEEYHRQLQLDNPQD